MAMKDSMETFQSNPNINRELMNMLITLNRDELQDLLTSCQNQIQQITTQASYNFLTSGSSGKRYQNGAKHESNTTTAQTHKFEHSDLTEEGIETLDFQALLTLHHNITQLLDRISKSE